jgi:hypothetical protein
MSSVDGVHASSTVSTGPVGASHTPSVHVPAHVPQDAPHTGSGPQVRAPHWGAHVAGTHAPCSHVSSRR